MLALLKLPLPALAQTLRFFVGHDPPCAYLLSQPEATVAVRKKLLFHSGITKHVNREQKRRVKRNELEMPSLVSLICYMFVYKLKIVTALL